jgi:hypothetical protein
MASEVLREFLVRLGYQTDRVSEERFVRGIEGATRLVRQLGLAVAGVSGTLGALTIGMARSLEGLYYSSRRLGSSADSIRAFSYAVSQMGGTSEEAQSSLENLARAMRNNPGIRGLVQSLAGPGVNTNDAVATMRALGRRFQSMPRHLATAYASQLGIDERTLDALIQGTDTFERRYRELARKMGVNLQDASGQARTFQQAWRDMLALGELALMRLMPTLERLAPLMVDFAERVLKGLEEVAPKINDFIQSIGGWEPVLIAIGVVLTAHLLNPLVQIARALGLLSVLRVPGWLLRVLGIGGAAAAGTFLGTLLYPSEANGGEREALERARRGEDPFPNLPATPRNPDGSVIREPSLMDRARSWWNRSTSAPTGGPGADLGRQAMEFFQAAGWSTAQAAGIVANLQHESGFRADAFNPAGGGNGAFGLAQWRGPRQQALGAFISRLRGRPTDFREATFQEQLAFIQHELTEGGERAAGRALRGASSASAAADVVMREYERPEAEHRDRFARVRGASADEWFRRAAPAGLASGRSPAAGGEMTVNQRTEITVTGAGEPGVVAQRVAQQQRDVNADLARNLQAALR